MAARNISCWTLVKQANLKLVVVDMNANAHLANDSASL